MKTKRIKQLLLTALCAVLLLSVVGCAQKKTTKEEVFNAIKEGKISTQDALEQEMITMDELKEGGFIVESFSKVTSSPKLQGFQTEDQFGNEVTDEIFKKADWTYVVFWSTDNEESFQEIKDLNDMYEYVTDKGYNFLGVVVDGIENKEKAVEMLKNNDIKFSNIIPDETMDIDKIVLSKEYPVAVTGNSDGALISAWTIGAVDKENLKKKVDYWNEKRNKQ